MKKKHEFIQHKYCIGYFMFAKFIILTGTDTNDFDTAKDQLRNINEGFRKMLDNDDETSGYGYIVDRVAKMIWCDSKDWHMHEYVIDALVREKEFAK